MNQELAKIFFEMARMLAADRVEFKPAAYRNAARSLADLEKDAALIYARGGLEALEEIPGVGQSIGKKIEEYIKTGRIAEYEKLKKRLPIDWEQLASVPGVGPKRAKVFFQKLGVRDLADLEAAARAGKIGRLPGFGQKSQENIVQGVEFRKKSFGRFLLGEILPQARALKADLASKKFFDKIEIAGSLRRQKETIGDIDILASGPAGKVNKAMDYFTAMPEVEKVWGKGLTKSSVRFKGGFNVDLRVVPAKSFGAALQYFTGSKEHNIELRRRAQDLGYKLSEYGLFKGEKMVAGDNEAEIYQKLGMAWITPEMRQGGGEIGAALAGDLPRAISRGALKGDLHCHSNWNGGHDGIDQIAAAAKALGYEYIGIADHTKFLKIENGLDEEKLARRNRVIDELNRKDPNFKILKGCEANILADGAIDIDDAALAELDFAIAGIHSHMGLDKTKMTARLIKAMENPHVDIVSHPTGRLIGRRPEYEIDFEAICRAAAKTGTILEINADWHRLDLNAEHIRAAAKLGVKFAIGSDAHHIGHLPVVEFGLAQARAGWAVADDIVNTYSREKLKKFLKKSG